MMENNFNASPLPVKTWRYLKINSTPVSIPENLAFGGKIEILGDCPNVSVKNSSVDEVLEFSEKISKKINLKTEKSENIKIHGSLGNDFEKWILSQNPVVKFAEVKNESDCSPLHVKLSVKNAEQSAIIFAIHAKENSTSSFVFESNSEESDAGLIAVYVLLFIEENAQVELTQVQFMGKKSLYFFDTATVQSENAKFYLLRGNFGSEKSMIGTNAVLVGKNAEIQEQLAYITDKNQKLDINDIAHHYGKSTKSNFNTQGVMLGESYKNYKGTIDFIRGASGSEGSELEDVLLLSDDAINKTTPIILCDEEDVVGNHGATLGKIDESLLFYMKSRGIDEEKAKQMVANGKLCKIISLMPSEEIEKKSLAYIDNAFEK